MVSYTSYKSSYKPWKTTVLGNFEGNMGEYPQKQA